MKIHCLCFFIVFCFCFTCAAQKRTSPADLVVKNASIYTVDAKRSWAQSLAVKNGRLVFIGNDADAKRWIGSSTRIVDAGKRLILPGFHDTHVHLALAASRDQYCDLGYPPTLSATLKAIKACVERSANAAWILMSNPNTAVFPPDGPDREFLDRIVLNRPLVINALHSSFVNSPALKLAGITAATKNPDKGLIVRDANGRPTGTLRAAAQDLIYKVVPKPSNEEMTASFRKLLNTLPGYGIVSVQELSGTNRTPLYAEAQQKKWLTTRLRQGQMLPGGTDAPDLVGGKARFVANARRYRDRWFNAGSVKIFVDGDLGDRTAALFEPYLGANADGSRGEPVWTPEQLNEWTKALDAAGLQIQFHAMGDRAVNMALNAVEQALTTNGRRDARHQITHLHVVASEDVPRFKKLGVVANIQPYFAENIEYNTVRALELLGVNRHGWMFRFHDLVASGAIVAASTDGPVASPLNPFVSIQSALTRREAGSKSPAFIPEQRLTLPEVLAAYTINGAYANFLDKESGSLEIGKWADFVMLEKNLFEMDPEEIHGDRVLWTVIEGREAYRAEGWR